MSCRLRKFVGATAILALVCSTSLVSSAQDSTKARVEALAKPYVDAEMVAGLSIGVIDNGKQTQVHLGQISDGGKQPDSETIYEIGSVSKVFTGILLADAVNRNELKLDQAAQELLPAGVTMPKWKDQPITLGNLAMHSSGLPRLSDNMPSVTSDNPYADYTSKLAYDFLNKHELQRAPRSKQEYSNFGMSLLGHLISQKAGGSYDDLLTERITGPLGMKDTSVALTDSMKSRLATPHIGHGITSSNWDFADMPGAGGIRSSTGDMLRFAQACLNPPNDDAGRALELAWKQHRKGGPGESTMGLGWHFDGDGATRWHNGQTGGYHSMLLVNRDAKRAVVVLSNTALMELDALGKDLMRMLSGDDVKPREFEKTVKVSPKVMQRYVGRYELVPTFVFTVSVEDEKMMVGVTNQPTVQVYPRSETEWFYKIVDATLTFKLSDEGKCKELELFQNGVRQTAKRIE